MGGETHFFPYIWDRIIGALLILYIGGFKGKKMDKFIPDRKIITIIAFDKPMSEWFAPNIRTEKKVTSHRFCLAMKYRFGKFDVNCFWKTFTFLVPLLL